MAASTGLKRTYDPTSAARALGLGVSTIYELILNGRIRATLRPVTASKYRISESALNEFRANQKKENGRAQIPQKAATQRS